jgi:hypothetical protein
MSGDVVLDGGRCGMLVAAGLNVGLHPGMNDRPHVVGAEAGFQVLPVSGQGCEVLRFVRVVRNHVGVQFRKAHLRHGGGGLALGDLAEPFGQDVPRLGLRLGVGSFLDAPTTD